MGARFAAQCGGQAFRRGDDHSFTATLQKRQAGNNLG
ncbi:Uncharacterised protein [Citrobacter freundii]|nr:Uncharacterised protein [Citrobacter freundii]